VSAPAGGRWFTDSATILALAVISGIVIPPLAALMRPLLLPSIFFLMLLSLLAIDLPRAFTDRRADLAWLPVLGAWQLVVLPAVIGALHLYTPLGGAYSEIAFFTASACSIFGAPAFARLMGLDEALTLRGTLVSVLVMPATLPLLALAVRGSAAGFDAADYAVRIVVFLAAPMVIAAACNLRPDFAARVRRAAIVRHGGVLFLCVFAVGVMDGIGARILSRPSDMLALLGLAFAVHLAQFGTTMLVFSYRGRRFALSAALLASYRNLGLLFAVAGPMLPQGFILFVALWQVPMYLMPLAMRRLVSQPRSTG
jgi:hypothetical protein